MTSQSAEKLQQSSHVTGQPGHDFRPAAAELVLQLGQIPEGASEELSQLHDLHVLTKEMLRVTHDHAGGVFEKYSHKVRTMKELHDSFAPEKHDDSEESGDALNPALASRTKLATTVSAKMDALAITQYKELYVIRKIRADMDKYVQDNVSLREQLGETEQDIAQKRQEFNTVGAKHYTLVGQRGEAQRDKNRLETDYVLPRPNPNSPSNPQQLDESEANTYGLETDSAAPVPKSAPNPQQEKIDNIAIAIEFLTEQINQTALSTVEIHNSVIELTDSREKLLNSISSNDQHIAAAWRKINACLAVMQKNYSHYAELQEAKDFLEEDRQQLSSTALTLYQNAQSLRETHTQALHTKDYTATDYLEADVTPLKTAISTKEPRISELQDSVSEIKILASGNFGSVLDETTQENVSQRIKTDLFARQDESADSPLKKITFIQLPNTTDENHPYFSEHIRNAHLQLNDIRNNAVSCGATPYQFTTILPKRLQYALSANGKLLEIQRDDFNTLAFAVIASLENADNMLEDVKPIQLALDPVTEKYISYRKLQVPIVDDLARQTTENGSQTYQYQSYEAALVAQQDLLEASLATYVKEADRIIRNERKRLGETLSAEQEQLLKDAQQDENAMQALMDSFAYGQPHSDRAKDLPDYISTADQITAATAELKQTKANLASTKETLSKLQDSGIEMRAKLSEKNQCLQKEIARYNSFSAAPKAKIREDNIIINQELKTANEWLQKHGVNVIFDVETLKEEAATEQQENESQTTPDWRPRAHWGEQHAPVTSRVSGILSKISLRASLLLGQRGRL